MGIALALSFFCGGIGLLYASPSAGVIIIIIQIMCTFFCSLAGKNSLGITLFFGLISFFVCAGSIFLAYYAVKRHNEKVYKAYNHLMHTDEL